MSDWSQGYVTDVEYTHGFYRELTPAMLRFALLLRGLRSPSVDDPFTYCELGCGQGFSSNLLAAANPTGDFWAVDFNASHIAGAQALAREAGTPNIRFLDQSFGEFLDTETPSFDFIALHGVYSWISAENRRLIVQIARRKLKVGGVLYVSYNTLPGLSPVLPLRQLMIQHAAQSAGPTVQRIDRALEFASQLASLKAGYFQANPLAGARLDSMKSASRNYLAHEYFNRDWTPQYHAEVAQEMAEAKLNFAASATISDNFDGIGLPANARQVMAETTDPLFRETLRDYFTNQTFRRDIYVRGPVRLSAPERMDQLSALRFALTTPRALVPKTAAFPVGEVTLTPDIYDPVLDALAQGPQTLADLARGIDLGRGNGNQAVLLEALAILTSLGHVAPCLSEAGDDARRGRTGAFNQALQRQAQTVDRFHAHASPITGGGVGVSRIDQLFLDAVRQGRDPVNAAWDSLQAAGHRLVVQDKPLEGDEARAELASLHRTFENRQRPILTQLGIAQ